MVLAVRINLPNKACSLKLISLNELRESAKLSEQNSLLLILVGAVYEYDEAQKESSIFGGMGFANPCELH